MRTALKHFILSGSAAWNPVTAFGDDLVFYLDPANTKTMLQEDSTGVPTTDVTADTNPVGLIYSLGFGGHPVISLSANRRPLLGSDATRNSYLTFDGSADYMTVNNSAKYLRKFCESASVWSIMFWIKKGADGSTQCVMSQGRSAANVSMTIDLTSGNKVECYIAYASSPLYRFDKVSTASLTVAMGWTPVIIYANGNGAGAGTMIIGDNAPETFTINAVGSTADATNNLHIGASPVPGTYFNGSLSHIIFLNRIPTADEIAAFKAFNPARNSTDWYTLRQTHNGNNTARIWADTGKTTPITNGTAVRAWESELEATTPFGGTNRDLTTASAGVSPIYRAANINSLGAIEFDGSDDNFDFTEAIGSERGGRWTLFLVAKNEDATNGSHMLSGSDYDAWTGSNYSGNSPAGDSYVAPHANGGNVPSAVFKNKVEAYNVVCIIRDGDEITVATGNKVYSTVTNTNLMRFTDMGDEGSGLTDWQLDGFVTLEELYSGAMTRAQASARIDAINSTYAI